MTMTEHDIQSWAKDRRNEILRSDARPPRALPDPEAIPQELRDADRWLCWVWHRKDGKWTKRPVQQSRSVAASSTDQKTWTTFAKAFARAKANEDLAGVGFAIGDGFVGVDLDCCKKGSVLNAAARKMVGVIDSYTETSPTETGLKIITRGAKPANWVNSEEVEIYDGGRFFTITGQHFGEAREVRHFDFSMLGKTRRTKEFDHALNAMRKVQVEDGESDGSGRLIKYAAQTVRCGLDAADGLEAILEILEEFPAPKAWTDDEILQRIDQADKRRAATIQTRRLTLADLGKGYPERGPELIHGILRRGEIMNLVAASKEGKSWMVYGLALAVATGSAWLGHETVQGRVLLIDNELHPRELSFRMRRVADCLHVDAVNLGDSLLVEPLRGSWPDISSIDEMLERHYSTESINLIVLDAYYRLLPSGTSENDNSAVTAVFNHLDKIAARHDCAIAMVHHASKGDQSSKSITDVGSGAGALTRATDTHVILRPHEEDGCAVMEAVCRSHKQPEAKSLRFEFPLWSVDETIPPEVRAPKSDQDRKNAKSNQEADKMVLDHLEKEVTATTGEIRKATGLSYDRTNRTLRRLEDSEKILVFQEIKVRGQDTKVWARQDPIDHLI
jgi:hypothetical protein